MRVFELAKKLDLSNKELLSKLKELKVEVKSHMSSLSDETAEIIRREIETQRIKPSLPEVPLEERPKIKVIEAPKLKEIELKFPISVKELAVKLSAKPSELMKKLIERKILVTINQSLEEEVARRIAKEFGYELKPLPTDEELLLKAHSQVDSSKLRPRTPVVTLMGHVDHGKTSLLDAIRKSKIAERETGGITQHIGAYEVFLERGRIVFLDTPGHEAFTAMRARGASATDIVVLVVAGDDGVMPQTVEAIDHARAANAPIIVAINKIDKPNANIDRVKKQLSELNLTAEDWGGKTVTVGVSAKTGEGIDNLLEMILLETELLELKANPEGLASGVVIESRLTSDRGPVTTTLVKNGTLRVGNVIVCGIYYGKAKALINDRRHRLKEAKPSTPVEVLGLSGVPEAGELFYVVDDEKKAKEISLRKQVLQREKEWGVIRRISLEDLHQQIKEGKIKELNLIIKADVQGSLEALSDSLKKLSTEEIKLIIIHSGIGDITESDVMLASASNAVVIGFHVDMDVKVKELAKKEGVDTRLYRIIYEAIGDVKAAMEGMLEPLEKELLLGRAEVRQVFKLSKTGTVAGCFVQKGKILRSSYVRLIREEKIIFKGKIGSLKRFKDDVREVTEGFECGLGLAGFEDIKVGDTLEAYEIQKIARKLE